MEQRPFEIKVAGREYSLRLGHCACVLFRNQQEVDYLAVSEAQDTTIRIFNNQDLVRWLAGFAITDEGYPQMTMDGAVFAEEYGWNPAVIVKNAPSEEEVEWFLDVNAGKIDDEWEEFHQWKLPGL